MLLKRRKIKQKSQKHTTERFIRMIHKGRILRGKIMGFVVGEESPWEPGRVSEGFLEVAHLHPR